MKKTRRALLMEEFHQAAEWYWNSITQDGWSEEHKRQKLRYIAQVALRLHIFEQGGLQSW